LAEASTAHGGKAANLAWLIEQGYRVPTGVVVADPQAPGLSAWLEASRRYAVRSSASVEDSAEHSYAGQFESELDVAATDVPAAIGRVLQSATDERIRPYLEHTGISPSDITMHAVVQEMVAAKAAGVAFSRNPLTGLADVLIEAVSGSGEALVSGAATPERWIRHWGDWTHRPEEPQLPEPVAAELADLVASVADRRGEPVDLEWAWDGAELSLLQVRPMTTADVPVYSNRLAREFLPGTVPPLVWSVNVPIVNSAWLELFESLTGPLGLQPDDLARQFGYRAYFNMAAVGDIFESLSMPRDLLEVLMGLEGGEDRPTFRPRLSVMRHLPRMTRVGWRALRYHHELDRLMPQATAELERLEGLDLDGMTDERLVQHLAEIEALVRRLAFANILAPLLFSGWSAMLRRRLERRGVDAHALDIGAGDPALEGYDPTPHLARLATELDALDEPTQARVRGGELELLPGGPAFLQRFGALSDSGNDFSRVPWREDPSQLVPLLHAPVEREAGEAADELPAMSRLERWLAGRSARYRFERERVSLTYTRAYGLFRPASLAVASRLVAADRLNAADDVFWLTRAEVEAGLLAPVPDDLRASAAERRADAARFDDVDMPEVIFGDEFEPAPKTDPEHQLSGVPSARGIAQATARVVKGVEEAGRVKPGDVVVIPYSDVAWTPLLARSGGIVAESGGLLSHSSIVARELGIPCVVSVAGAMRIPDGAIVRLDGFTGEVQWEVGGVTGSRIVRADQGRRRPDERTMPEEAPA
jgi:pyruvate,water dikinase